jgi:hypothetical protein
MPSAPSRFCATALGGLIAFSASTRPAQAQGSSAPPALTSASVPQAVQEVVVAAPPAAAVHIPGRPSLLLQPLYVTTAIVQALDARSTFKALDAGAVESNSLVAPLATHRPAFVALKISMAAAFIYNGHKLSKRHRLLAAATLAGLNGVYGAIVRHNYDVARQAAAAQVARLPQ